jgi:hypothetical protein
LLTRNGKKYISAIVIIHDYAKEAVILHNPNAKFYLLDISLSTLLNHHEVANYIENGLVWERV